VLTSRTVSAGSGLTGGGDLSANRTLSLDATAVVAPSRTITAGTNLSGGGDLSTNRTISHAASGVTANTYPSPSSVTVDAQGHVTAITAGGGSTALFLPADWAHARLTSGVGGGSWTLGMKFHALAPCVISSIRFAWPGSSPVTLKVSLWNEAGTVVRTINVTTTGAGLYTADIPDYTISSGEVYKPHTVGYWENTGSGYGSYIVGGNYHPFVPYINGNLLAIAHNLQSPGDTLPVGSGGSEFSAIHPVVQ
jgi:hypothetical protein